MCNSALIAWPGHAETELFLTKLAGRRQGASPLRVTLAVPPPLPDDAENRDGEGAPVSSELVLPGSILAEEPDAAPVDEDATVDELDVAALVQEAADAEAVLREEEKLIRPDDMPPIPLFSDLAPDELLALFRGVRMRGARAGENVLLEGDPGDAMLIIVQGSVRVLRKDKLGRDVPVATMGEGAVVGELALLSRSQRLATVRAETDCVFMELTRTDVDDVVARHPAVGAALDRFYKQRLLQNVLRGSPIFRALGAETHAELMAASTLRAAAPGDVMVKQGTPSGGLWLILRGRCEASARNADGSIQVFPDMREGDVFGEISLALGTTATATVTAAVPSVVFMLPAEAFDRLVRPNPQAASALKQLGEERLRRMGLEETLDLGP